MSPTFSRSLHLLSSIPHAFLDPPPPSAHTLGYLVFPPLPPLSLSGRIDWEIPCSFIENPSAFTKAMYVQWARLLSAVLLAWLTQEPLSCSAAAGPKIYVADVPKKYNLGLLETLATDQEFRDKDFVETMLASPYGPRIVGEGFDGLRQSSYMGLDIAFHLHVLRSPLRTRNAAQADIVFVPFYVHKIAAMKQYYLIEGITDLLDSWWTESTSFLPYLGSKPHWIATAYLELDLLSGCGSAWGIDFLCHPLAEQYLITVVEAFTGLHGQYAPEKGNLSSHCCRPSSASIGHQDPHASACRSCKLVLDWSSGTLAQQCDCRSLHDTETRCSWIRACQWRLLLAVFAGIKESPHDAIFQEPHRFEGNTEGAVWSL